MTSEPIDEKVSDQGMGASSGAAFRLLTWLRTQWDTMGGTNLSGETMLACLSMAIFPIVHWLFLEPLAVHFLLEVVSQLATLFCSVLVIVRAFWPMQTDGHTRSSILPELLIATAYHCLWVAALVFTNAVYGSGR